MTYADCLTYLFGLQRHGIKLGLENITQLLSHLNHPQRRFPVLHIGGTNGKGSSAAMATGVLQALGFRVGLYTSPHLVDFRERIRVQGECIGEESVRDFVRNLLANSTTDPGFTFFEIATAMAFRHFADERVDIAVVEVGMGGRFDATNVCQPVGTLVTSLDLDHQAYLGDTLPAIAFEKAGIFKPTIPVVLGPMLDPAKEVLVEQASKVGAPVYEYGRDFVAKERADGQFDYDGIVNHFQSLLCPLAGSHQVVNAANALALLEVSIIPGLSLIQKGIKQGFKGISWEGRLECVGNAPLTYLDGAHNPASAQVIVEFFRREKASCPDRRVIMVLGMMNDKNIGEFLKIVTPIVDTLILTRIDHPRAATLEELKMAVPTSMVSVKECPQPQEAWDLAHQMAQSQDVICVTGSLFLVGHMKSVLSGCRYAPVVG